MINASPELSAQLNDFPELHPKTDPPRNSPIRGVLMTNSDLDHVLGLFSLREGDRLNVCATAAVRATLTESLGMESVLNSFCGLTWREPPIKDFEPLDPDLPVKTGLRFRAIELPGAPPRFSPGAPLKGAHSVAYLFESSLTNHRLLVAPDVGAVNPALRLALASADGVLFEGTFWSKDELRSIRSGAPEANEMGHVTIKDCSLELLTGIQAQKKIYIHINNTNPILMNDSAQRKAVEAAGLTVGWDGLEFEI